MHVATDINAKDAPAQPKGLRDLWYSRGGTAIRRFIRAFFFCIFSLIGELTAVVLGLGIAGIWFATSVLDKQSTDLTVLRPNIKMWFAEAFDGQDAEFGKLEFTWLPASDQLVVTIEDAEIRGEEGEVLETFDLIRTTLAHDGQSLKLPQLINAEVKGGVLSYFEDETGHIMAGFGPPETIGRFGPVYRSDQASTSKINFRNTLQAFEFIQIDDAQVYIRNDVSGIDLKSDVKSLRAAFSEAGNLTLAADGTFDQSSGAMPFTVASVVDQDFENIKMRLNVKGARPDEIAPTKGRFWEFQGLAAPVDLTVEVDFSRKEGLQAAEVEMEVSKGRFTLLRENEMRVQDTRSFPLESLVARAVLAPGDERMDVSQLDLNSPNLSFKASGFLTDLGKLSDGDLNSSPTFNLSADNIRMNMTPKFVSETNIKQLTLIGQADVDSRQLTIDKGSVGLFESVHEFTGRFAVTPRNQLKTVSLQSGMTGHLRPQEFLSLWPAEAIGGARRWIERAFQTGLITQLDTELNLDEGFFENPGLNDDRVKLRFSGQDFGVKYMATMPMAKGVQGSGEIIGNRLTASFNDGTVGTVTLKNGRVDIPVLLPKGGNILITANGVGQASDLLSIADNPPFEIAKRYEVDPNDLEGQGDISIDITRPLLEFFPREQILYQVNGQFTDVKAPFQFGRFEVSNGSVSLDANRERAVMNGPVDIGPWRAKMRWEERFGEAETLSQYGVTGTLNADVLDELGLGSRTWFDGNAAVRIEAESRGMDVETAKLDIDFKDSEISVERVWMKPEGEEARLLAQLKRTPDKGFLIENAQLIGEDINLNGRIELDADYKTRQIDLSEVQISSLIDGAVRITPDRQAGRLGLEVHAKYLDVSPWTDDLFAQRQSNIDVPLFLRGRVDTLILDRNYEVKDTVVDFSHTGEVIETARLEALSDGKPLRLELVTKGDKKRQVLVKIPDASKAISAFLGMNNTTGGSLELNVNLPAAGEEGAFVGEADMVDFTLKEAPAMAQLLSLASLTGLADTLTTGSMQFDRFHLPFTILGDDISIRDARLYGPALGMTADGDVDLNLRAMDFDGTLVPAYTANSLLGDIPILGELFAQEEGGGLFALTYKINGPFEKTQISVNPLSALTPGFLRGIFKSDRSDMDEAMKEAIEDVAPKSVEAP